MIKSSALLYKSWRQGANAAFLYATECRMPGRLHFKFHIAFTTFYMCCAKIPRMRFRDKLARFMYGRYGSDEFNKFLMYVELSFFVLGLILRMFFRWGNFFYYGCLAVIIYMYFRMFSKNIYKRRKENEIYLRVRYKVKDFFRSHKSAKNYSGRASTSNGRRGSEINYDDMFKIYRCPTCGQRIRVPRGKGRIRITCPKCKGQFIKKT